MKQVKQRMLLILILAALLAAGTVIYCVRYVTRGSDWAAFPSNQHAFTEGSLATGQILDRSGTVLYDPACGAYAADSTIRKATTRWATLTATLPTAPDPPFCQIWWDLTHSPAPPPAAARSI